MSNPIILPSELKTTRGIRKPKVGVTAFTKEGKNLDFHATISRHTTFFGQQIVMKLQHPTDDPDKIRQRMYYMLRNNRKLFNKRKISINLTLEQDLTTPDKKYYTYRGDLVDFRNYKLKTVGNVKGAIDKILDKSPIEEWHKAQFAYSVTGQKTLKVEKLIINVVRP